jgi:hypothetical protein
MLSDIRDTFENLERKYEKMRQDLDSLTDDVLYFKAGADKWSIVEAISDKNVGNLVYRHPFAGPLEMAETLRFIDVHFDNHLRHLENINARAK